MPTPAQLHLERQQRRRPPQYARTRADRALQLYALLAPGLPAELRALVEDGTVALGEVGRLRPDVVTLPVAGGGFAIEFTTGMMDFAWAVGRALSGAHVAHAAAGAATGPATGLAPVVRHVGEVFERFRFHARWGWIFFGRRFEPAAFPIDPDTLEWITTLVDTAELYMLAHEFGHVALDRKLLPRLSANEEQDADAYGLGFFLGPAAKRVSLRRAYAAAVFAIRLFAGLERIGVKFSAAYPPANTRIERLRQQVKATAPAEPYFHEASTIAVAYLDIMDDVENQIDRGEVLPDAERTLVRLLAQLQEVAKGKVAQSVFVRDIADMANRLPPATMRQAAETLVVYYVPPTEFHAPSRAGDHFLSLALRVQMAEALIKTVEALPSRLQPLFPFPTATPPHAPPTPAC